MYEPFPIFDLKEGKVTAKEPWLSPKDAFETLDDCHLKHGILEKRKGYSLFGQVLKVDTSTKAPTLSTNPVMGVKNYLSGETENFVAFDKTRMNNIVSSPSTNKTITAFANAGNGEVTVTATAHGFTTDDIVTISGTTSYNGTFNITRVDADNFKITDTWVADDAAGTASQEKFLDVTRNKIRYIGKITQNWTPGVGDTVKGATSAATGVVEALILDTGTVVGNNARGTIIFENSGVTGTFQDNEELQEDGTPANIAGQSDGANSDDAWTGDNTNFFHCMNWNDVMYIANNNDPIQKYDGTNLSRMVVDIGDDDDKNDINYALMIFVYKERLLLLRTNEDGTNYFQRARWSTIKDPQSWPTANFKDAPTAEVIVSAGFLGDDLYVWFENSVYRLAWTGNASDPFEWIKVSSTEGAVAVNSVVNTPIRDIETQIAVGPNRIQANDRRNIIGIDRKIPDFVLTWTQDSLSYSNGLLLAEERQAWESYADSEAVANADGNTYPNKALVMNYEDLNWATYTLPIHTMGLSTLESDVTWDIDDAWEDIEYSWDALNIQSGFPTSLMGSQDGKVYQLNTTDADNGSAIRFDALSSRWNPYTQEGRRARLYKIEFLVDVDTNASFDVESFVNSDTTKFQTKTVTCTAVDNADDKSWHTVYVRATGFFHRINITNNASGNRPRIHAIIPWFQRAGGHLG